ncbi:SNF2-related protein [Kribbella flavida DSM 17836]|uniref:SNF2-related protein n=1 Tax=Kribbella flavida (strain DSM 17836 / JCM 10339 / NBRC 14399) TaxID=479435 RepID=D2Q0Y7_KRIFD|nr:SNF2-related protein [Kribbella flavida]ADB35688.1 SNF2-related protein [Kribbella flavida DSM 17836]
MTDQGETETADRMRSSVGRAARDLIRRVDELRVRAETLIGRPDSLREQAHEQLAVLTQRQVVRELESLPVTALQEVTGTRVGMLEKAGYRTIGRLAGVSSAELVALPGIGPKTADKITEAVRAVVGDVARSAQFRFQPDRPDDAQRDLLATLTAIRRADAAVAGLIGPVRELTGVTQEWLVAAAPTRRRLSMWMSGRDKKQAALLALSRLETIDQHPRTAWLAKEIARHEQAVALTGYTDERLWREYAADAAAVNAVLSTVGGVQVEVEAAQGFIPEELRQRITAVPLDTSLVKSTLRGYQVFGAQYLIHQERSILGDEMGLGKTIQALAAAAHLAAHGQQRFLVVCPASVQMNWLNEISKHTQLEPHNLHGPQRDGAARRWLRDGGVAVTTFGTLGSLDVLKGHGQALLVVDEAHYVKNPKARRSQVVGRAVAAAQRVVFLTGTPMENRVEEFRNLVEHLQPATAKGLKAINAVAGAKQFRRAVAPVYLRRNQEDVLTELPEKIEIDDWVLPTAEDKAAYVSAVRSGNLMRMRQAAFEVAGSAKLERIAEIVEEAREDGRKVVVFSYFLTVLDRIEQAVGPTTGSIRGAVGPTERQRLVDEFTAAPGHAVLLSQIEAGGVGLNMQAASVVILAEPHWKPSTEQQAVARAHRMGQIRTVQVHRLLAKDTVDDRIREVQEHKRLLFDEYARKSDAKQLDPRAVDHRAHRLDDDRVPVQDRIVLAEQHRLGITSGASPTEPTPG